MAAKRKKQREYRGANDRTYSQESLSDSFLSSLKRSSSGRVIKPNLKNMFSVYESSPELAYSYDRDGTLKGLNCVALPLKPPRLLGGEKEEREINQNKRPNNEEQVLRDNSQTASNDVCGSVTSKVERPASSASGRQRRGEGHVSKRNSCNDEEIGIDSLISRPMISDKDVNKSHEVRKRTKVRAEKVKECLTTASGRKSLLKNSNGNRASLTATPKRVRFEKEDDDNGEINDSNIWTEADIRQLKTTVYRVPALDEDFWETVGRRMRRPPSHCQCQYQKSVSIPCSLTEVKTLDAHVEKGITAQPGTIKRRRQIRALLDDNGYFDDGADATPLREKLREAARMHIDEEEEEKEEETKEERSRPPVYESPAHRNQVLPLSSSTPFSAINHLSSRKRDNTDQVVYHYRKARKQSKPVQKVKPVQLHVQETVSKPVAGSSTCKTKPGETVRSLSHQISTICKRLNPLESEDEEEEFNETLSDMEEDFKNVRALLKL